MKRCIGYTISYRHVVSNIQPNAFVVIHLILLFWDINIPVLVNNLVTSHLNSHFVSLNFSISLLEKERENAVIFRIQVIQCIKIPAKM